MVSRDFSTWVPVVLDNLPQGTEIQQSVLKAVGMPRPMTSDTMEIPALLGSDVGGGATLVEDTHDGLKVLLPSYLFTGRHQLDEAETEDSAADPIGPITAEWLSELNVSIDAAAFGVTGARSTTATDYRPYNSVYYRVRNSDADTGYTADTNYVSGAVTYAHLSQTLSKLEESRYWAESGLVIVAHPSFRHALRSIVDENDRPIFISANGSVAQDTLFDHPIRWSLGAKTCTTYKRTTVGNPLLIPINRRYLAYGARVAPQTRMIPAAQNPDELAHVLQHRSRDGMTLTVPGAAAVFEKTS